MRRIRLSLIFVPLVAVLVARSGAGPLDEEPESGHPARLHVLAIGIDRYPHLHEAEQLELAVKDVRSLVESIRTHAPAAAGSAHVTILLDEAATRRAIEQAFEDLTRAARPQDTVLVHFAGNAGEVPDDELGVEIALWAHETTNEARRTGQGAGLVTLGRVGSWMTRI